MTPFSPLVPSSFFLAALVVVAAAAQPARAEDDNAVRVVDLTKRFTYKNVTKNEAGSIFSSLGISSTFNPAKKMSNPDPTWIPGWSTLTLTDETQTAIVQAAINRTWTAQVDVDYKTFRAAWNAIDKKFRPRLEAAKTGSYYTRVEALRTLFAEVKKQAETDNVFYAPFYTVGFLDEIVVAMAELHRETKREFLLKDAANSSDIRLDDFIAKGRPFAPDAVERDLFVAFTVENGNYTTPELPTMNSYGKAFAAVKWPTANNAATAKATAAKMVKANEAALTMTVRLERIPSLFQGMLADPADPKLFYIDPPQGSASDGFSPLVVTKVSSKGGLTIAELLTTRTERVPYGCKKTRQLDSNGNFVLDCKYKPVDTKSTLTVTFSELPDGVTLAKGDALALYGDVESKKEGKGSVSYVVNARSVASIKRGSATIWK